MPFGFLGGRDWDWFGREAGGFQGRRAETGSLKDLVLIFGVSWALHGDNLLSGLVCKDCRDCIM